MELKILIFLNVLLYSVIVSQSFMYMIALRNIQENMGAAFYIELRKLLDRNFLRKYKFVVYSALLLSCLLLLAAFFQSSVLFLAGSILAFVGLLACKLFTAAVKLFFYPCFKVAFSRLR